MALLNSRKRVGKLKGLLCKLYKNKNNKAFTVDTYARSLGLTIYNNTIQAYF